MEISEEMQKYFEGLNVQITIYPEQIIKKFSNLRELYEFIVTEKDYWSNCTSGKTVEIRNKFLNIYENLTNAINTYSKDNPYNWQQYLRNAVNAASLNGFPNIFSISSYGQFIKERYTINYEQANACIDFIQGNQFSYMNSREYFKGLLYAFNWSNSEEALTRYDETQDLTFSELKKRYFEALGNLHTEYLSKNQEVQQTYDQLNNETTLWKDNIQKETSDYLGDKKKKLEELEKTYEENLKLKAPADYWDKLREDYENIGNSWRSWTVFTSVILMSLLTTILYKLPEELKVSVNNISFENIRAIIILTVIISIGIYLIRLFVKLSLSAYHLARDAKERYQLTYVYLSLLNEGKISESERGIVFQALFSRADTGLLKGDSSPTIPDGMIQQIAKLVSK